MKGKGSKRVEIIGLNDKRQITSLFCAALVGELLPLQPICQRQQLVYQGLLSFHSEMLNIHQIIGLTSRRQRSTFVK